MLAIETELEGDVHLGCADAQEAVVGFPLRRCLPRLPPQRPRHGVHEGGLPVAVAARDTGYVEGSEVERGNVFAVAQEVSEG